MTQRLHVADDHAEQLLADRNPISGDPLAIFCSDVRRACRSDLRASPALSVVLAEGLSHDKGDLPVTAASNVTGPAPQASGLSIRRKNRMIPSLLTKLAAAGLAVKAAAATGAVVVAGTAIAATGNMPALPDQSDAIVETFDAPEDVRQDGDVRRDEDVRDEEADVDPLSAEEVGEGGEGSGAPEGTFGFIVQGFTETGADFGAAVSEAAKAMGAEKAAAGRDVADDADAERQDGEVREDATSTADDNPGSDARAAHQPATTPPAGGDADTEADVVETEDDGERPEDAGSQADDGGSEASGGRRP